jgi:hypothetical protein
MPAQARRLSEEGRGGFREMVAAASGRQPLAGAASGSLDFAACLLDGAGWSVTLSQGQRMARFQDAQGALPPLLNPLGLLEPPRPVEPRPVDLSARDLDRLASSGVFALEGEPGTYKLTVRLEAQNNALAAFRVEDASEGVPLGWMATGPALPSAIFPLAIPKTERRPMALRVVRVDPNSGAELPWDAPEISRVWCSYQGPGLWTCLPVADDAGRAGLREVWGRALGGGALSMEMAWSIAEDAQALRVALDWSRTGEKFYPPLALGAAGYADAQPLEPEELSFPELADALGASPAAGWRFIPRARPGRSEGLGALLWLADRPFEAILPEGNPGAGALRPEPGKTRFALLREVAEA